MGPRPHASSGKAPSRAWVFAVAAGVLLAGCVVDQAREVAKYRQVLDDHAPKPKPLEPGETLTLGRALALANADNEQIASQGETYLQALINKNRAFAAFLPTLSFQPNFTLEEAPSGNAATASPGAPSGNAASAAATSGGFVQRGRTLHRLEAPVVGAMNFSFRSKPLYDAARLEVVQQRQLLLDYRSTILLNVAQTYFQVLTSTQQVAVLVHSVDLQKARVRDLENRFGVHLALALDVSQAKANEAASRVQLSHARNDARNARRTLALLIGAPEVNGPLVSAIPLADSPESAAAFVARGLRNRQDLLAAQSAVKEAHDAVDAAVAEYYPSASLNVAGYLFRENYANSSKWDGILLANLPLFSAGTIRDDVRQAWSHLRQAALFESYLRREIAQGVETAYDNWETSDVELADLQREVQAASEAYRQADQQEKNGLAIPLDVLTAQDTLLNAQLQYASESYARTVFQLDLLRAAGELGPETPDALHWSAGETVPALP